MMTYLRSYGTLKMNQKKKTKKTNEGEIKTYQMISITSLTQSEDTLESIIKAMTDVMSIGDVAK